MGHITKEQVANIRAELKRVFPNVTFSVTRKNQMEVCISIMKAEFDFGTDYEPVNHYWIESNYKGEIAKFLEGVKGIAESQNYNDCVHNCPDYGRYPSYCIAISIGQWNKPYTQI